MLLAHKIALDPTDAQRRYFAQASGVARFAWNWALAEWSRQHKEGGKPSDIALRKQLNGIKREQFPWMFDVTKCAAQEAIIDLGAAFGNFFRDVKKPKAQRRFHYPRFKHKDMPPSFCAANEVGTFHASGKRIKLPVVGWVRMREAVRFSGPMKRATVSREAGRWFVSLMIDTPDVQPVEGLSGAVGVDLGVKALATLSTGETIDGPKAHRDTLKRLRRANKAFARKKRGSANSRKAKRRLGRIHQRIGNIRKDALHKLTTRLATGFAVIGIEDLNVRGMVANRTLARAVSDMGFFEFRRQLDYKCRMYGSRLVVVNRWFPSSKTCSCCGVVKPTLALNERHFACADCGFEADRDLNAALNLKTMADSLSVSACGEIRSGAERKPRVKRASMKQEETPEIREVA